jgi:hypothetical protein
MHIGYEGNARRKRLLGKPRRGWVDNIRMGFRKNECGGVHWTDVAQDKYQ